MKKGKNLLVPRSVLGKWTIGLLIAFFLFLATGMLVVASGQEGGDTIFDNLYIFIPMISAGICAVASFFTGIISIIWKKERCIITELNLSL